MPIKAGAAVRQIVHAVEGTVTKRQFNESASEMEYLVENTDADGTVHSRWFLESQIAEVGAPA